MMINQNNLLPGFFKKVTKIFEVLGVSGNNSKILENLVSSLFINFSRLLASDEKIAPLLDNFSQTSGNNYKKLFDFLDSKNVNYQVFFSLSERQILKSLVSELGSALTSEKVDKLNEIISE